MDRCGGARAQEMWMGSQACHPASHLPRLVLAASSSVRCLRFCTAGVPQPAVRRQGRHLQPGHVHVGAGLARPPCRAVLAWLWPSILVSVPPCKASTVCLSDTLQVQLVQPNHPHRPDPAERRPIAPGAVRRQGAGRGGSRTSRDTAKSRIALPLVAAWAKQGVAALSSMPVPSCAATCLQCHLARCPRLPAAGGRWLPAAHAGHSACWCAGGDRGVLEGRC
jgi:hypothetical protein